MYKLPTVMLALLLGSASFAQNLPGGHAYANFSQSVNMTGKEAMPTSRFTKLVEGTPYFRDEWYEGVIVLADDQQCKSVPVKLDLFDHELHFKDEKGVERIPSTPVKEVVLTDTHDINYRFIYSSYLPPAETKPKTGWYQWLRSGKVQVYKFYTKELLQERQFNSAVVEERIQTTEKYFVYHNHTYYPVKKPKDILSILADKRSELSQYLKGMDKNGVTEEDLMVALVNHYESLVVRNK